MSANPSAPRQRVVLFNYLSTIGPGQVGGLDTVARAIEELCEETGREVVYVSYGWSKSEQGQSDKDLRFPDLSGALEYMASSAGTVLTFYVDPASRLRFARFRRKHVKQIRFVTYLSVWNPSAPRRLMAFADLLLRYNGGVYCASGRLVKMARRFDSRSVLLYPPIRSIVVAPPPRPSSERPLRLYFAGRFDRRKGLFDAIEIMQCVQKLIPCKCTIAGYFWPDDPGEAAIRSRFAELQGIEIHETKAGDWSQKKELDMQKRLAETDIMLLPYRKLSSTVDTPLLLLEAMAFGCAVYLPRRVREMLGNVYAHPAFAPENDAPETVARWVAGLDGNRQALAAGQQEIIAKHQVLQQETRAHLLRILNVAG